MSAKSDLKALLGIGNARLYCMLHSGQLPATKVRGRWKIDMDAMKRMVCGLRQSEQATQTPLSWSEKRAMRYIVTLVEMEKPATEEERQTLRMEWAAQGAEAVIEAMHYVRAKQKASTR